MPKFGKNLLADVRRRSKELQETLTYEDLIQSPELGNYLARMAASLTGRFGLKAPKVTLVNQGPKGTTAFTNGTKMTVNLTSSFSEGYDALPNKIMSLLGLVFHEDGHILYCDFNEFRKATKHVLAGRFYGDPPEPKTKQEEENLIELEEAMENEKFRPVFARIYGDLENRTIDAHDEAKLVEDFGPLIESALAINNSVIWRTTPTLEEMEAKSKLRLTTLYNTVLQMCLFGDVHRESDDVFENSDIMKTVSSMSGAIQTAVTTDSMKERYSSLNRMVLCMWPYIKEVLEATAPEPDKDPGDGTSSEDASSGSPEDDSASDSEGSADDGSMPSESSSATGSAPTPSSGMRELTDEQIEAVLEALESGAATITSSIDPTAGRSSDVAIALRRAAESETDEEADTGEESESTDDSSETTEDGKPERHAPSTVIELDAEAEAAISALLREVSTAEAEKEAEELLADGMRESLSGSITGRFHEGMPLRVDRVLDYSMSEEDMYKEIAAEVKPHAKRLQRQIEEILRDLRAGSTRRHLLYGRKLDAKNAYRPDQRIFKDRKLPQDLPDMAVALLVDESGSMSSSDRIGYARKAAIMLYEFCDMLGVPVHVAGHDETFTHPTVRYTVYADFDKVGTRDRYRLAKIRAKENNRDGMALQMCATRLANRPEEVKLLIVISDGEPLAYNYSGPSANQDVRDVVRRAKKMGIEVIAAAIGGDKLAIRSIYGDGFLDITDLRTLPKTMVKLVQKRIIPT